MTSEESANSIALQAVTVRSMVGDIVAEVAPEELPLIDRMGGLDDRVIVRQLRRRRPPREPLGFGVDEVVALVTPVVWLVLDKVAEHAVDAAVDGIGARVKALLRTIFRKSTPSVVTPPLAPGQLEEVRRWVLELAEQRGIDPDQAVEIAEAVEKRLQRGTSDGSDNNTTTEEHLRSTENEGDHGTEE
ncbi:hypothetical protein K7711_46000 [Nocardia sp. CA2R105]|uniref:hypothetical protein n=1 Tax=Nocardia coffeae TaxID=2873381 RepID=UPI001CA79A1C|nr:hypothetical protein [Nocardia coffeae]MBY8863885.1 hypothetical protein [Nocardia coffeae]